MERKSLAQINLGLSTYNLHITIIAAKSINHSQINIASQASYFPYYSFMEDAFSLGNSE